MVATAEKKHRCGLVNTSFKEPGPTAYAGSACRTYFVLALNVAACVQAFQARQWQSFTVMSAGLLLDAVIEARAKYDALKAFAGVDGANITRTRVVIDVLACFIRADVGIEAWRYLKRGDKPLFFLVAHRRGRSAFLQKLPVTMSTLRALLMGRNLTTYSYIVLTANLTVSVIGAGLSFMLSHRIGGPPNRLENWRLVNENTHHVALHMYIVMFIDMSQVAYRLLGFSFIYIFVDMQSMMTLIFAFYVVTGVLLHYGLFMCPAFHNWYFAALQAAYIAADMAIYDVFWFECPPPLSLYIQYLYPLRLLQALVGVWLIQSKWDVPDEWNHTVFWISFGACVFSAACYFITYFVFVFKILGDAQSAKWLQRDAMFALWTDINQSKGKDKGEGNDKTPGSGKRDEKPSIGKGKGKEPSNLVWL